MRHLSLISKLGILALSASVVVPSSVFAKGPKGSSKAPGKGGGSAAQPASPLTADGLAQEIWANEELFNQLSTASQMKLERQFGFRQKPHAVWDGGFGGPNSPTSPTSPTRPDRPTAQPSNFLVNAVPDPTIQDTQSSTALALGTGNNLVSVFNDSGSYVPGPIYKFSGWSTSANSAVNWTDQGTLPSTVGPDGEGDAGAPFLDRSVKTGTFHLVTLPSSNKPKVLLMRSTDGGVTFTQPVNAVPGLQVGVDFPDRPSVKVDNIPGNAESGFGNVYVAVRTFRASGIVGGGVLLFRSTDDGNTWGPEGGSLISFDGQAGEVTVGADHSVYVSWFDYSQPVRALKMRRSTDFGATFGTTRTIASLNGTGVFGDLNIGMRTNSAPHCEAHPTRAQRLYCVFNDRPAMGADRANIYFTTSDNFGATWTPLVTPLNFDDPTTNDNFHPSITLNPAGTAGMVSWYDRRRDAGNQQLDVFGVTFQINPGTGAGAFGSNFLITTVSFPPAYAQDPSVGVRYFTDNDQSDSSDDTFYRAWADNRLSNAFHQFQPDVRIAAIPTAGPGANLVYLSTTIVSPDADGQIDANECNQLTVVLRNYGSADATAVVGSLVTSTPGVTISQTPQGYPNILAGGGSGGNTSPFYLTTGPGFVCGDPIDLTINVTTAQGVFNLPFTLPSGAPQILRFDNNTVTPIPDSIGMAGGPVVFIPFVVSGVTSNLTDVDLSFYIKHSYVGDLVIGLQPPGGAPGVLAVPYFLPNGTPGGVPDMGSACMDQNRFIFDQQAATSISNATPPFVGRFSGANGFPPLLGSFVGMTPAQANGVWNLVVRDFAQVDTGDVMCASLILRQQATCVGGGTCPLTISCSGAPTSGVAPLNVNFTSAGAGGTGAYAYSWTFGDGFTGNISNPVHTYSLPGAYVASVTVNDGMTTSAPCFVNITAGIAAVTPTVSAITPDCGNMATGGTVLTITGTNFDPLAAVSVVGVPATVTVDSSTQITAVTSQPPPGFPNPGPAVTGNVVVTNPGGFAGTLPNAFTYAVRGDANNSGTLEAADIFAINARLTLGVPPVLPSLCNYDANTSGAIEPSDMFFLNSVLLGLIPPPGP